MTAPAILATIISSLVVGVMILASGGGMFSAGSLNAESGANIKGFTSHAEIGNNCDLCHPSPWSVETMTDRCLVCHTNVGDQLANRQTLHGAMLINTKIPCQSCHPDHNGPSAALTAMNERSFPHEQLGFSLQAHNRRSDGKVFGCKDCHANDLTKFDQVLCSDCHQQLDKVFMARHLNDYGTDCLGCHDGLESISKNFDHGRMNFKLEGKHIGLACTKCHVNAHSAEELKATPTDCFTCHQKDDTHKGEFGKECGTCHKPVGWKPATFDHNLSAFKLDGKHADVKCADCHINNVFKGTAKECFACHQKDDEHDGKFGQDCSACHKPDGWKPATFDHNLSSFKLEGKHASVACADCHKNNVFKGTPTECVSCHLDPAYHAGMFPGQACSTCHTTSSWRPAKFVGQHTFPMDHGERNNNCADCHQPTLKEWTCYTCHDQGENARKHQEEGISNFDDCLRCHPDGQEKEGGD